MQTLRRELIKTFVVVLQKDLDTFSDAVIATMAIHLANAALELRAFKTDENRPSYGLDWKLGHGVDVSVEDLTAAKIADEAPRKFEAAFGFGSLPWSSNDTWEAMRKFVTEIYSRDRLAFGNYIVWRASKEGKYTAMSNKQIRLNPQVFMDTGWHEFANREAAPKQESKGGKAASKVAEIFYANR